MVNPKTIIINFFHKIMRTFPVILLKGEFICKEFFKEHEGERHTVEEWKRLVSKYRSEEDEDAVLCCTVRNFSSESEADAYFEAIYDVENYLSSDFYTFCCITPDMIVIPEKK